MISTALALMLMGAPDAAHEFDGPPELVTIRETSFRPIDFMPDGWKLYDKVDGDLNGDGREDSVLVIQLNDPALLIKNSDGLGMDQYDSNPRILLVIMQDDMGQFRLVDRNNRIIPDHNSPTISDPYEMIAIRDGKLHLSLAFFANAGSWIMSSQQFNFRWNGVAMALIGFDRSEVHRASGEMKQTSINYLTGRRQDSVGSIEDSKTDWQWSDLPQGERSLMQHLGNGFEFEG